MLCSTSRRRSKQSSHKALLAAARRRGYSVTLLRLALAAYRIPRSVRVDGVYTKDLVATRGITAGSSFATSELRLLLLDVVLPVLHQWGDDVDLTLYVDDLSIATKGDPETAAARCADVVRFVVCKLEDGLGMTVSEKKSVVLSSVPAVAQRTAQMVAQPPPLRQTQRAAKVKAVRKAKHLGVATAAGAARSVVALKARIATFRGQIDRYQALHRLGVNTHAMVQATAGPAMLYGVEVCGVADAMLHQVRVAGSKAAAAGAGGKAVDRIWYSIDAAQGTADPAFVAHINPIKMWAVAWWERWVSHEALENAHWESRRKLAKLERQWSAAVGPADAVYLTATRLGW